MTPCQKIINFFFRQPEAFIRMVSEYYTFQPHEIRKYFKQLDFRWISRNPYCHWDSTTIHQFKELIDWSLFSRYCNAFRDISLIEEFKAEIVWKDYKDRDGDLDLSFNPNVPWSDEFISTYENFIDFSQLSWCKYIPWSEELIEKYFDRWDWNALSANGRLPWSEIFIDKYQQRWNWEEIIFLNDYFPWSVSIAKKYFHKLLELDIDLVLDNGMLWSNIDILEEFADYVDWNRVANNGSLPWHKENLLDRWKDRLQGASFVVNTTFVSDPQFFEDNIDRYLANDAGLFWWLSSSQVLPWSISFIDRFKDYWQWEFLSTNESLPWSMELIDYYLDKWNWGSNDNRTPYIDHPRNSGLINNEGIPWDIDWILKYESFIDVKSLSLEPMIWEKVFKPYMDEKIVNTIFRLI